MKVLGYEKVGMNYVLDIRLNDGTCDLYTTADAARLTGIPRKRLRQRLETGVPLEDILKPVRDYAFQDGRDVKPRKRKLSGVPAQPHQSWALIGAQGQLSGI